MSDTEPVTKAVLTTDGRVLVEQPDGSYRAEKRRTNWAKVDPTSEAEIAAAIASDPGDPATDPDFWDRARLLHPQPKARVTIRLDEDVLTWFRRQGRGCQARINAILRGHYERAREQDGRP